VVLRANSIPGKLNKNKFESSETPTRTETVSVNCSVYCWSNDDRTRKCLLIRNISSDGQCASSVIVRHNTKKLKVMVIAELQ